ncbi:hypothetical protein IBTHAUMO2_1090010 [Nitrosopumilaceae archaeon]|nr:hypothetical protein [Nitrosopumilus sp.]CAI9830780.1 hypothetical protein IBTHAUMO2_1090010 [Nitrosopumilaceae archaeon]
MRIDQFVYTTADIDGRLGYQVVARSSGITDEMVSVMYGYMHPAGIEPNRFKESRSLRLLDGGPAIYCIARNAGAGHDGRPHTLYCHAFAVDAAEFAASGYDTRVFDVLYVEDKGARGTLPHLDLELDPKPAGSGHDARCLAAALAPLFQGQRTAIVSDGRLLQDLLRMLPPSIRLVPFSTLVIQPDRQPEYRLVACPDIVRYRLPKDFAIVPPVDDPPEDVSYYAGIAAGGQQDRMDGIQRMFDSQGLPGLEGLGLACDRDRHALAPAAERPAIAARILRRAWDLGDEAFTECLGDVAGSLELEDPRGGWIRVSGAVPRNERHDPAPWNIFHPALWMASSLLDYDGWFGSGENQLAGLARLSDAKSRSAIRFTYGGHPIILLRFKLADGMLRGIQVGGKSDGPLPRAAEFEADRISDIRSAAGYADADPPVPDNAPPVPVGAAVRNAP